jgi:hypothetical protein
MRLIHSIYDLRFPILDLRWRNYTTGPEEIETKARLVKSNASLPSIGQGIWLNPKPDYQAIGPKTFTRMW